MRSGNIVASTQEILKKSADTLGCERVNAWIFDPAGKELRSLQSYSRSLHEYEVEPNLSGLLLPKYFQHLKRNEIIVSDDAKTEKINEELVDSYLIPNDITAMIDVPIRAEGKMVGVICFEHVGKTHHWKPEEAKFALSIGQLVSLLLETSHKNSYRKELETALQEKDILISEVHHRVKNNMAVIMSLINLQKYKALDDYHADLFEELKNKVYSMANVQEKLHTSQALTSIDLKNYLEDVVTNLNHAYGQNKHIDLKLELEPCEVDITKAVPCGLIANEVLTNSFKYAFGAENEHPRLAVKCYKIDNKICIEFKDNGPGLSKKKQDNGMGLELIKDLTEQIGGEIEISENHGLITCLTF